jgi:large subunit ribosomal protein L25
MITFKANNRASKDAVSNIRAEGNIPAVVYGPKFVNTSISINYQDFVRIYNKHGETTLIQLDIDGKTVNTLIHEIDLNPISNKVQHIDFYAPEAGKKVTTSVAVEFVGESAAVKAGANLVKVLHEIEVEALPENLPRFIEVDISLITTIDVSVHVKDLKFPKGVETTLDPETVVASAVEAKEEPAEPVTVDLSAIEVEKKGKTEEEGAEGEGDKKE